MYDQRKGGYHRVLSNEQVADVRAKLQHYRPVDVLGEDQVATTDGLHWTVADLKPALARWQGVTYQSDTSYRTLLKRCGYSYQRAGKQFRSRSQDKLAEFEERLEKKLMDIAQTAPQTVILAEDEASLYLQATTMAAWRFSAFQQRRRS